MGTLGYKVFEKLAETKELPQQIEMPNDNDLLLHLKRKSKKSGLIIEANCKQTNEGFVVLKGSHIEIIDSDSIPPAIKETRKKAPIDQNGILQEDILFRSPSYAAAFVIGGHANGLIEWKTENGKTLKERENSEDSQS